MIKEAHDELLDIQSSGRSKELLAQVRGRVRAGEGGRVRVRAGGRTNGMLCVA